MRRLVMLTGLLLAANSPGGARAQVGAGAPGGDPLAGTAMWIWHVADSSGGTPAGIGARARASRVSTVIVKAAHGPDRWPQFSSGLVDGLHAEGLRVCAYQRLLGRRPRAEAAAAIAAVRTGADCFVIDGEAELEGRYTAARTYVRALRAGVGADYPVAFTSFPYAGLHPDLPYSVFLGPCGAQLNLPQIYWRAIGDPVAVAWARTYRDLSIYPAPLRPVGQLFGRPSPAEIARFGRLAAAYGALGHSWWVWEQATPAQFTTIGETAAAPAVAPQGGARHPLLRTGARGDAVRQAQILLRTTTHPVTVDGRFGAGVRRALLALQADEGLSATGALDDPTWDALLRSGGQAAAACTASRMTLRSAPFSR